jgi:hypothetical protein
MSEQSGFAADSGFGLLKTLKGVHSLTRLERWDRAISLFILVVVWGGMVLLGIAAVGAEFQNWTVGQLVYSPAGVIAGILLGAGGARVGYAESRAVVEIGDKGIEVRVPCPLCRWHVARGGISRLAIMRGHGNWVLRVERRVGRPKLLILTSSMERALGLTS